MQIKEQDVLVSVDEGIVLEGSLAIPEGARALVLFAHGSGSSRHSPRNGSVARSFQDRGLATLLIDLLTAEEEQAERWTRHLRFDIGLLAQRLMEATAWLVRDERTRSLAIAYFGSSTGAAAALMAAAQLPENIQAVVSRGGRPDLARDSLPYVRARTLLIVGGDDDVVIDLNRGALRMLRCEKRMEIVPGATHLFEEPGALERVAEFAGDWFSESFKTGEHLPVQRT